MLATLAPFLALYLRIPSVSCTKLNYLGPVYLPMTYFILLGGEDLAHRWPRLGQRWPDVWLVLAALVSYRMWSPDGM
jgi:hypothetical protein